MIRPCKNSITLSLTIEKHIAKTTTPEPEYPNENDSEDTDTSKASIIPTFMLKILTGDEITLGINSNGRNVEPVHMLLLDCGGTSKSHLVKVIYNAISKITLSL